MTNSPKRLDPLNLLAILVALLVVSLAAHIPLLITVCFGEPDAARMANDSIKAMYNDRFYELEYTVYSSPLYSDVLRLVLKTGVVSISDIPFWMTLVTLVSSAVVTVAMFVFVFRLTASVLMALGASLILQLMPVFWFNSLHGFPSIVALAFFMASLALFQSALDDRLSRYKHLLLFGASTLFVLAVMTKIDVLLASAIYCLPVWRSDRSLRTKVIWIGCLALFSGFVFLLFDQYAESLVSTSQKMAFDWSGFNSAFPSHFGTFFSRGNLKIIAKTVGILSIPTALIGLVLIGRRREWRSTIFWLAVSGLPLVLFWGMRPGNSTRHNFIPGLFLCIMLVLPLTMRAWHKWAWAGFLCIICLTNYFYYSPSAGTVFSPSGRLLASAHLHRKEVEDLHMIGETIARLPHDKVAIIGQGPMHPYFRFEVLRNNQLSYMKHTASMEVQILEMQNDNRTQSFLWLYHEPERSEIVALAGDGYFLVICERRTASELDYLTELQGKWVSLDQLEHRSLEIH